MAASARAFTLQKSLPLSYAQYTRLESGRQFPTLEVALQLAPALQVSALEMAMTWLQCRAQLSDLADSMLSEELQAMEPVLRAQLQWRGRTQTLMRGRADPAAVADPYVFSGQQEELRARLSQDPWIRDVFVYVNSNYPDWIQEQELADVLGISVADLTLRTALLAREGVLQSAGGRLRAKRRTYYFPDTEAFFQARNLNFSHNVSRILPTLSFGELAARRAFRSVISRVLTGDQLAQVIGRLEQLLQEMSEYPDPKEPGAIFSLCILMGERFRKPRD